MLSMRLQICEDPVEQLHSDGGEAVYLNAHTIRQKPRASRA